MLKASGIIRTLMEKDCIPEIVVSNYDVGKVLEYGFISLGENNDSYFIKTTSGKYLVRIYGLNKRITGMQDIRFELDLLVFLNGKGHHVHLPLAGINGSCLTPVQCPEGERVACLFTFVEGSAFAADTLSDAAELGESIGRLHQSMAAYPGGHARESSVAFSLNGLAADIEESFAHHPEIASLFTRVADLFHNILQPLRSSGCDYNVIHGDLHLDNGIRTGNGFAYFDFAECGSGWRLYDLAKVKGSSDELNLKKSYWNAFVKAYFKVADLRFFSDHLIRTMFLLESFENDVCIQLSSPLQRMRVNPYALREELKGFVSALSVS